MDGTNDTADGIDGNRTRGHDWAFMMDDTGGPVRSALRHNWVARRKGTVAVLGAAWESCGLEQVQLKHRARG
jgi:hypothetical protein